jgi:transaldolase/glucose-6-phosphate isomerase
MPHSTEYPDTFYVDELIGAETVITFTPQTLDAFLDHGTAAYTIDKDLEQAEEHLRSLTDLGIDLEAMTEEIQSSHLNASDKQYQSLVQSVIRKLYVEAPTADFRV